MPLFSIVIVSLNTKNEFLKTIKSVVKQKYKNYEIVVDGKSEDGTIDVIKKLKKKKNIKFIIEKDKGIYDAMNKGIKKSSGKWIIFLNSGDIFHDLNVLKKYSKKTFTIMKFCLEIFLVNNKISIIFLKLNILLMKLC